MNELTISIVDICHERHAVYNPSEFIDIYHKEAVIRTDIVQIELWVELASLVRHDVGTSVYLQAKGMEDQGLG